MHARNVRILLVPALLLATAGSLRAQQGAVEIGVDAAVAYETEAEVFTASAPFGGTIGAFVGPQSGIRVGFFLTDAVALEPVVNFQFVDTSDDDPEAAFASAAKLLYHFSTDPEATRLYVGVGPTLTVINTSDTDSQFGLTGELGAKVPVQERIGLRFAAGFRHGFDTDDFPETNVIFGTFGLSVFLGGS
ncbi:MAG: outer membrane beta-barrel protein [Gemmatimonadota bacterium]|nr:outer membrane beta-barrel protein [Gemmatimonadota bacterium]